MVRSHTSRIRALAPVALALLGCLTLSGCATKETERDLTIAGTFAAGEAISILNLTIANGRYSVDYQLDVLVAPTGPAGKLDCRVVDTAARIEFFDALDRSAMPAQWARLAARGDFDLPELTLALQCSFDAATTASIVIRDARLQVRELT
ncbi:MAG: hypothetical protein LH471_07080 [Salinibacterium sp.]|nr:hypothetical protein [Salinibacterium sp.]